MTYYINPIWFYLMNVGDMLHEILFIGGIIICSITLVFAVLYFELYFDNNKSFKKIIIISGIAIFLGILIPSKETCIEMMIASQVTQENVTYTKKEIYELIDYITDKINENKESGEV